MTPAAQRSRAASNAPFAALAGALLTLADILLHPGIVLIFFVTQLGATQRQVAAVFVVGILGWLAPRWLLPWFVGPGSRQLPWALGASLVQSASAIFLAYIAHRDDIGDSQRLGSFFICFGALSVASGFAHGPVNELIARAAPGSAARSVLAWRTTLGALLVLGAAAIAPRVLGDSGPDFPRNVALLFIVAAASTSAATFFIARLREPESAGPSGRLTAADLARVVADGAYRRFALFGIICALATVGDPFYLVFARNEFRLPVTWIGTLLAGYALALVLTGPLWTWLIRRTGARTGMQIAVALRVAAPLIAVFLPYVLKSQEYRDRITNPDVPHWAVVLQFALLGASLRGFVAGNAEYAAAITVPARRAAYNALVLLPMLVAGLAPLVALQILNRWDYETLFLCALFAGFLAVLAGGLLVDGHARVRHSAGAWRLTRARP